MIRLSKQTDYGILLLTRFVETGEAHTLTARSLAEGTGIPLPTVSKVLKLLAREELLASHRGAHGGYSLAKQPADISVVDIIHALEGGVGLTECVMSPGECDHELTCRVSANWRLINDAVVDALRRISLLDMAGPLPHELMPLTLGAFTAPSSTLPTRSKNGF
jgi:FeS assembly SUF system regulator